MTAFARALRSRGVEKRPSKSQLGSAAGIRVGTKRANGRSQERAGRGFRAKEQHKTRPMSLWGVDAAIRVFSCEKRNPIVQVEDLGRKVGRGFQGLD